MLPLNGTLALYSALTSSGVFNCNSRDVDILYKQSNASPIMYFQCLVITGLAHPSYCDNSFYNTLTSSCISCTFSTLTANLMPCFNECADVADGEFCTTCTTEYVSRWHSTCAPTIEIILPDIVDSATACSESVIPHGLDIYAMDMANCLSLNVKRNVECMTELGYVDLPETCSDCIYAVQDVTDSACESVCVGRPFSSFCRKCVSTYVQANTANCFGSDSFTIPVDSPCLDADLSLIGSDSDLAIPITNHCIESQTCTSAVYSGSSVSTQCATCLNSAVLSECSSSTCLPDLSLLDCVELPVYDPTPEESSVCMFSDIAFFYSKSSIMLQVNACLYESLDVSVCFAPIYDAVTVQCASCFSSSIAVNLDCSGQCLTETSGEDQTVLVKSTGCQSCLSGAFNESVQDCFSTGTVTSCDVESISAISFDSWGGSIFARCLLSTGFSTSSMVENCFTVAGFQDTITEPCQACVSKVITQDTECKELCLSSSSDTCRACISNFSANASKKCTTNSKILQGGAADSNNSSMWTIDFSIFLISLGIVFYQ